MLDIALIIVSRPRSGFSFLPTPDGILLHGGYCKEYVKGSRPIGVMLDDTWFLRCVARQANTSYVHRALIPE